VFFLVAAACSQEKPAPLAALHIYANSMTIEDGWRDTGNQASTEHSVPAQFSEIAISRHICASNTNHFGIIPIVPSQVSTN
jgi:hypothetical protein